MKTRLILLAALLFAAPALAADGDIIRTYGSGAYCVQEVLLCDGDHVDGSPSDNGCPNDIRWDLHRGALSTATVAAAAAQGMPNHFVVEVRADNCDATKTTFNVLGYDESDGTGTHTLSTAGVLQLGSSRTSLTVHPGTHRYINVEIATEGGAAASCTDLEVVLRAFTPKVEGRKCPGT